jgi:hypothetical protein
MEKNREANGSICFCSRQNLEHKTEFSLFGWEKRLSRLTKLAPFSASAIQYQRLGVAYKFTKVRASKKLLKTWKANYLTDFW